MYLGSTYNTKVGQPIKGKAIDFKPSLDAYARIVRLLITIIIVTYISLFVP